MILRCIAYFRKVERCSDEFEAPDEYAAYDQADGILRELGPDWEFTDMEFIEIDN